MPHQNRCPNPSPDPNPSSSPSSSSDPNPSSNPSSSPNLSPGPNPRPKPYPSPGSNQVFYLGDDDQWDDGDSIFYGEKGEVTGSVVEDVHVDPPEFLLVVACSRGQNTHLSGHAAARAPGHPAPWEAAALRGAALLRGPREEHPHGVDAGEKLRGALVPAQGGRSTHCTALGPRRPSRACLASRLRHFASRACRR